LIDLQKKGKKEKKEGEGSCQTLPGLCVEYVYIILVTAGTGTGTMPAVNMYQKAFL
jgi:hypothetical protein